LDWNSEWETITKGADPVGDDPVSAASTRSPTRQTARRTRDNGPSCILSQKLEGRKGKERKGIEKKGNLDEPLSLPL